MAASNPSKEFLNSKFTVNAVAEFQVGYQNERNKETFFSNYATESRGKPSTDEQIKAVVVHVILENNLGYRTEYFGERKFVVKNALRLAVGSFKFSVTP